ncbi:hypothetical protein G9A89_003260 [Geosiphon pyriformis]|nr:hypothetical protein G9A89_003260 [Geosiphon pyriformis]
MFSSFHFWDKTSMLTVLGESKFCRFFSSLCHYSVAFVKQLYCQKGTIFNWKTFKCWKKLDPYGFVPDWFRLSVNFLGGVASSFVCFFSLDESELLSVLRFSEFGLICNQLLDVGADTLSVYINGSLKDLGSANVRAGTVVFFENVNLDLGVRISGLLSSTLAELQTIALALECVPSFSSVCLFTDSQAVLDACKSELSLVHPDFQNWC